MEERNGHDERRASSPVGMNQERESKNDNKHAQANDCDDVFELDGDRFYDTITNDGSDALYWEMRFDKSHDATYFYHFLSGASQWEPPEHLVDRMTQQVVLWDDHMQWFYLYHLESGSSEWMSERQVQEFFWNSSSMDGVLNKCPQQQKSQRMDNRKDEDQSLGVDHPNNAEEDESESIVSVATTDEMEEAVADVHKMP